MFLIPNLPLNGRDVPAHYRPVDELFVGKKMSDITSNTLSFGTLWYFSASMSS